MPDETWAIPASSSARKPINRFSTVSPCTKPDRKAYSLTDCISMEAMRQEGITDILTHDNHFTQEGFTILP